MKYLVSHILIFVLLSACSGYYRGVKLSILTVNSNYKNDRIIDRYPDYGDGHRDGCIVKREMRIDLDTKQKGLVSGVISESESKTKTPLRGVLIKITYSSGQKLETVSDSIGRFTLRAEERATRLEASYIGYRHFVATI